MRLNRVLAATLAALFVGGCSARPDPDKSAASKAGATVGPEEKPSVKPSHAETSAPPPQARPSPAEMASLPEQHKDQPEGEPTAPSPPPDPYADISVEWRPYYEQFEEILEPIVKTGVRLAFEPKLHEHERKARAVVRLSQCKVSLPQEAEKDLRARLAKAKDTEIAAQEYLVAATSLVGVAIEDKQLVAAYERLIDQGNEAALPADSRQKLAKLRQSNAPEEAFALAHNPSRTIGTETEVVRTKLLEKSLWGNDLFTLAVPIHRLGENVVEKRDLCRTLYDLVIALPEPQRTDILMRLTWSPDQEKELDEARAKLREVKPSRTKPSRTALLQHKRPQYEREYTKELEAIAADRQAKFRALEQARRDTIEGLLCNVDAIGWKYLVDLDELVAKLQDALDHILPDLGYRLRPLIPPDAPRDDARNILAKTPIPGSVEDRVPTIKIIDEQIVFDAPAGQPSYAEVLESVP